MANLVPAIARAAYIIRGPARVVAVVSAWLGLLPAVVARLRRLVEVLVAAHVARLAARRARSPARAAPAAAAAAAR